MTVSLLEYSKTTREDHETHERIISMYIDLK